MVRDLDAARDRYDGLPLIQANTVKVFVDGVIEGNPLNDPPTLPNAAVVNPYKQPRFDIDEAAGRADIVGYVDTGSELCQRVREEMAPALSLAQPQAPHRRPTARPPVGCHGLGAGVPTHNKPRVDGLAENCGIPGRSSRAP